LLAGALVGGVVAGLTYGLLAFAMGVPYKGTSIANFAQGQTGVLALFILLPYILHPKIAAWLLALMVVVVGGALGGASYLICERFNGYVSHLSLVIRTLGLYLLMSSIAAAVWAQGEPYPVPSIVPSGSVALADVRITYLSIATATIAVVLTGGLWFVFTRTRFGLIFRGIAADRSVARLLGVRVRRFDLTAWSLAGAISGLVGMLIAPSELLTTTMLDGFLLYAMASLIIGGLDSLPGAWVGGLIVGIVGNVAAVYLAPEISELVVYGLILAALLLRPQGLFGSSSVSRL
jgi:branched-chain amino acid transport system permease protein